jgi:hypothetical protein
VHEEEVDVTGVVDEESLVAGWHQVACLLVGSETNLHLKSVLLPLNISSTPGLMLEDRSVRNFRPLNNVLNPSGPHFEHHLWGVGLLW